MSAPYIGALANREFVKMNGLGNEIVIVDLRRAPKPIEPAAARAATHASADEISEMEEILDRQQEKLSKGDSAIPEDSEFHYSIALASGNSVVLKVLDTLMDLLRDTRERSLQVDGRPPKSLAGHRRILSAIKKHDAVAAEAAMRRHIEDVEEMVLEKL